MGKANASMLIAREEAKTSGLRHPVGKVKVCIDLLLPKLKVTRQLLIEIIDKYEVSHKSKKNNKFKKNKPPTQ